MKGKITVKDEKWYVEIQSDLHGYGIGWGDSKVYPLLVTDENIWEGKEVEVEPIHYDSNFMPVIVKIKEVVETTVVNTMPKNEEGKPFVNTMPMIEVNKSMKLFTIEQLQEAYKRGHMDGSLNNIDYSITDGFKPIELPSDEEIEKKANKIPIGKWETGVDEEGGYWIEPNTNEKWRWGGSMVGKGQSYILYNVEYIEKEAEKRFPYEKHMGATWENGLHEGFIMGAEWMKEQILNQNK